MSENQATLDLRKRGVWRLAPGLWCDRTVPGLISVAPEADNARDVRAALAKAGQLPGLREKGE